MMNNVTMVPLRVISEKLGFKVGWDPQNYGITIE
ncbi:stalk domain-containing protein [Paenibacillus anseongense]